MSRRSKRNRRSRAFICQGAVIQSVHPKGTFFSTCICGYTSKLKFSPDKAESPLLEHMTAVTGQIPQPAIVTIGTKQYAGWIAISTHMLSTGDDRELYLLRLSL